MSKVIELECVANRYGWGKVGEASEVAKLCKHQQNFSLDPQMTYAELWMGSHPQGPSKLLNNKSPPLYLDEYITKNPLVLGENVYQRFGSTLPFLFKVLSINKALSIQAHPDKAHAEQLHKQYPDKYPDPNHKPEMAIALTKFEALCGFRPISEILTYFHDLPEFLEVVGQEAVDELIKAEKASEKGHRKEAVHKALKNCVACLMTSDSNLVKIQLEKLIQRLNECHEKREDTTPYLGRLFLRIHEQFVGDIGCFMIYFLNYIQMDPYESIFLGPNVPHAYLSGDIIECMACSNNVVRAGLTPKYKDVKTLVEMLDYNPQTVEATKFNPQIVDSNTCIYNPPVDDFSVTKIHVDTNTINEYQFKEVLGPSILLAVHGEAQLVYTSESTEITLDVKRGTVLFVASNERIKLKNINTSKELLIFQAYCELNSS